MKTQTFWELHVECTGPTAELEAIFEQLLEACAVSFGRQDDPKQLNKVVGLFDLEPSLARVNFYFNRCTLANIKSVQLQKLAVTDWLSENRKEFPPFRIGRFWVHGSHITSPKPLGLFPLCVDVAQAFGSGAHATTKGCILAIQKASFSKRDINRILDLGCGSGILSMVAKSLNPSAAVIAADCEKISVETTRQNWHKNQYPKRAFFAVHSNGFSHESLRKKHKFDLIIANILAKPLKHLAPLIAQHLAFNGRVILSGLLSSQMRDIRAIYRHYHLHVMQHLQIEEWSTLLLAPKINFTRRQRLDGR